MFLFTQFDRLVFPYLEDFEAIRVLLTCHAAVKTCSYTLKNTIPFNKIPNRGEEKNDTFVMKLSIPNVSFYNDNNGDEHYSCFQKKKYLNMGKIQQLVCQNDHKCHHLYLFDQLTVAVIKSHQEYTISICPLLLTKLHTLIMATYDNCHMDDAFMKSLPASLKLFAVTNDAEKWNGKCSVYMFGKRLTMFYGIKYLGERLSMFYGIKYPRRIPFKNLTNQQKLSVAKVSRYVDCISHHFNAETLIEMLRSVSVSGSESDVLDVLFLIKNAFF